MRFVIIGNGILACTTAFRLARRAGPTDRILVLGQRERPGSATLAAAAMLNSFAELGHGTLRSEVEMFHFGLSHLATRMWHRFILEIMDVAGCRLPAACSQCQGRCGGCYDLGTYLINNTAADDLDDRNFQAVEAALREFEEPYQRLDPADIPGYQPEQRYRATQALYIPSEGWLNPRLVLEALDAALLSSPHVELVASDAARLVAGTGGIQHVELQDGRRIEGDKFLLACGARVSDLIVASRLDLRIPRIFYGIGVSLELSSPEFPLQRTIRTPNRGLACGLYAVPYFKKPEVNDTVLIGASNLISPVPQEQGRAISVHSLLRGAMEQINTNFYRATLARVNVGWRPTSADTFPVVGQTSLPNLVVATGTKRDGFHLSPVLSRDLTAILHDEHSSLDEGYRWFAPERELIRTLTREEGVQKGAEHMLNAAYQHGLVPPHGRMPELLLKTYREDLERLHDRVGADDWGIPPELIEMYRYRHIHAEPSQTRAVTRQGVA